MNKMSNGHVELTYSKLEHVKFYFWKIDEFWRRVLNELFASKILNLSKYIQFQGEKNWSRGANRRFQVQVTIRCFQVQVFEKIIEKKTRFFLYSARFFTNHSKYFLYYMNKNCIQNRA